MNLFKTTALMAMLMLPLTLMALTPREEIALKPERAGGVFYAYPVTESLNTPAPKGFEPVYISHMGRHGSRYLIKETEYDNLRKILRKAHKAGALTPKGEQVYTDFMVAYEEADGHAGDLSPLGARQHKEIAGRMAEAYPQVFKGSRKVNAVSTMVMRCAMSMAAFCERLKELNPQLEISRDPSERHVRYIMYNSPEMKSYNSEAGPWKEEYRKLRNRWIKPDRLVGELFNDSIYVRRYVNPVEFTSMLFNLAVDMQNVENPRPFLNLFTLDEIYNMWRVTNFRMYAHYSTYAPAGDAVISSSKPLLRKIIEDADRSLAAGDVAADLRFGHDINILPLSGLLGMDGCAPVVDDPELVQDQFQSYNLSPKAANIQLVFFKNKKGEVIVKFMLNEREKSIPCPTDMFPFYRWDDVKAYYEPILKKE